MVKLHRTVGISLPAGRVDTGEPGDREDMLASYKANHVHIVVRCFWPCVLPLLRNKYAPERGMGWACSTRRWRQETQITQMMPDSIEYV